MTLFPDLPVSFSKINEIIMLPIRSKLLRTGIELGVFDHLDRPRTADEISGIIGSNPENTGHLLDGLTTIGLLEKREGHYDNSIMASTYLVSGKETYLGELFDQYQRTLVEPLDDLTAMVRHGPFLPPEGSGLTDPNYFDRYASALANAARGGHAQIVSGIVRDIPGSKREKLLDIGGGPGIIAMAILDENPEMTGTVFEQPNMAKVARKTISEYGFGERLDVKEGDFLIDDPGNGYDLILASYCLYFGKHCLDKVVGKIFQSLEPNGVFVSIHEGLTEEGTQPEILVLPQMGYNMMGHPMAFRWGELAESMRRCGFSSVESRPETTPFGEVELVIGRK